MIRKRYQLNWIFECPDAVLTCSVLKYSENKNFLVFGGHDKRLYLMDETMNIIDDRKFDGWVRCSYPIDLDGDGCDEILVGAGDGHFMVLKLNIEKKKFIGLMRYKSSNKVNCCIAGDFTRDGNIELIFGSEDKTVRIFDDIKAKEPKFIFYYDSWVTACTLGFLKLPDEEDPIYVLIVGTKNGQIQVIQFKDGMPYVIWNRNFNTQINDIKVGDVTNDGFNEIILSSDDSTIKIINSQGESIEEIRTEEGRPISLLIEDVDGDNAQEIVAGCADGSLKVYHNPSLDSKDFELKWKTKVGTSIKHVCYMLGKDQNLKHIIFGGYERAIRNVTDFEWGQKQPLNIPQKIELPEIQIGRKEELIVDLAMLEEVPTNIREHIFKFLKDKGHLKDLMKELKDLGYSNDEILDEMELLKTQKSVIYEKVTYPIWSLPEEEIEEKVEVEPAIKEPKIAVKHMVIEEPIKTAKEKLSAVLPSAPKEKAPIESTPEEKVSDAVSLRDVIIEYLKQKELVATKAEFIVDIKAKGFGVKNIEKEINDLKNQDKIKYSRSTPKGWSLVK